MEGNRNKEVRRRICIKNFGAIENATIDLDNAFLVLIGPQASGKSTFAKVVYFCRKIRDYLIDYAHELWNGSLGGEYYTNFVKYLRNPFMGYFGTTKHMMDFSITYYFDVDADDFVSIKLDDSRFAKFSFSKGLNGKIQALIRDAVGFAKKTTGDFSDVVYLQTSFFSQFKREVCSIFKDDEALLYIPAGRNLLATIPDLILPDQGGIKSKNGVDITQTDLITQEFIHHIQRMRRRFGSRLNEIKETYLKTVKGQIRNEDVEIACDLIRRILKADYVFDNEGERLYYDKDSWVKLMFGSSGQQEVLWAINCVFLSILQNEKTFLVIEEPEAHIFPDAQELITQLIALFINSSQSEVLLTTHSPYILTSLNLLVFSAQVERDNKDAIVNKKCRINGDSLSAYLIDAERGFVDIVDNNRRLIDALEIDHISDSINDRMEYLLRKQLGE